MQQTGTNYTQSVGGVVIHEGKVLLGRHTYGAGNGLLIIPGGYVDYGESPQQAVAREFMEETGVTVEAQDVLGVRFNTHDWYVVFRARYVSGDIHADETENSEVVWMDVNEALAADDVPQLTRQMIRAAIGPGVGFTAADYEGGSKYAPCSLLCKALGDHYA